MATVMTALALRLVAPPPPAPLVRDAQACFRFVRLAIAVHPYQARLHREPRSCPVPRAFQLPLAPRPAAPVRSPALRQHVERKMVPGPRPRSLGARPLSPAETREMQVGIARLTRQGVYDLRPATLADCPTGPCPWVSCRYHLKLDVDEVTGIVKDMWPGRDVTEMPETCAMRVAARVHLTGEPAPLEMVGKHLNLTMERARQIEADAQRKTRRQLGRGRSKSLDCESER